MGRSGTPSPYLKFIAEGFPHLKCSNDEGEQNENTRERF